ncbi:MAG: Rossmann-like and DUF2520 domain-containing protein [Bacteroidota bacterium]|nr:Rossmann-like and DUF2520 domain-containing protein [Bacteroidota bacterium]
MQKIILIGSGNVAHHLATALYDVGHQILQVISQSKKNAAALAQKVNADSETDLEKIKKADFTIVAVNDDAIAEVVSKIHNMPIAHTSGSVSIENVGVLYPVQTLSKEVALNIKEVPFCVSSTDKVFEKVLLNVAKSISKKVVQIEQEQRKTLHLAAVFACNFPNHMYAIAEQLLAKSNLDFELLKPLITETANKITSNAPKDVQTGPAKRKDLQTINNHVNLLDNEDLKKIYKLITYQIQKEK